MMSDEGTATEEHAEGKAPDHTMNDDNVTADWVVAVIPNENVSIHYTVAPKDEKDAITSVTTSFTLQRDQMVVHTFAGSTTQELISPKAGQGATGDCGVDAAIRSPSVLSEKVKKPPTSSSRDPSTRRF